MKYGLYIWLLLQLLCRSGVSAQELSGVVLGKKGNKPVENALVKTMASRNRMVVYTYTNGQGRFSLPDKPEADTLTVSCLGYETVSMPIGAFKAHATIYKSSLPVLGTVQTRLIKGADIDKKYCYYVIIIEDAPQHIVD